MNFEHTVDYIVIGGGASGCVIVNRLSANQATTVLLLEAGARDSDPGIHNLTGFVPLWGGDMDWKFDTVEQPGLGGRKLTITQGKVIGGGSSIHAMMYVRGNRMNFDQWKALGNDGWGYEDVLPYFTKSEDFDGGASEYHGVGGPLSVRTAPDSAAVSSAFQNGAVELGMNGPNWDYNGEKQEDGAGPLQFNITKDNKRASSASAFLTPVIDRANLTVKTNAEATRIIFEGKRAIGVEYVQDGKSVQVNAEKEVILCGGAFLSPKLLMLSGIGPAEHLNSHGISVIADLPGVGKNLQDHMQLPIIHKSKKDLPALTVLSGNVLFTNTREDNNTPDLQLIYSPAVPTAIAGAFNFDFPVSIFISILVQPKSRGTVSLRSANPQDTPIINPNYLQEQEDVETHVNAVKLARKLMNTKSFAQYYDGEIVPGPDADMEKFIRENASTIWHPVGTCKMGGDDLSVVDSRLKVHGLEGLRVADASIMPIVTSGNTYAATVMIGEKLVEML